MKSRVLGLSAALLCAVLASPPVLAQSTEFTYQGKLKLSGVVVNGTADFQFRLYNSPTGSTQIGSTQSVSNMSVSGGEFTVPLNFGANAFTGDDRYLEIAVRSPANTGNFVILTPRQKLTAAPYALRSAKPWGTNGTATFFTDGNVGIGTSSPNAKLDVRSGNNSYWQIDNTNGDLHTNGGSDGVAGIYNDSTDAAARTEFILNGQPHMVINKLGGVGIGTTAPARRLTVVDGGIFTARFEGTHPIGSVVEFACTPANASWELGVAGPEIPWGMPPGCMYFYKQGVPGELGIPMVIAPNHWVGLGISNPGFRLDLPNIGNADGRGRANQWVTYSSMRWKENVQTLDNALDTIMQLRGVSFDWKPEHGGTHDIGFVAEEVGKVVPELVSWEADGKFAQGLAYDRVTALAVEAIKQQQAQITDLQQANEEMRQQIATLMHLAEAVNGAAAAE